MDKRRTCRSDCSQFPVPGNSSIILEGFARHASGTEKKVTNFIGKSDAGLMVAQLTSSVLRALAGAGEGSNEHRLPHCWSAHLAHDGAGMMQVSQARLEASRQQQQQFLQQHGLHRQAGTQPYAPPAQVSHRASR